ncbi:MAG: TetR/AcrR family transcriptional regulator [Alphaproteobacteria bacterium]
MPRSKAFDPDTALRKAMQLFWRQGYEATTIDELVHAMAVNRASLYATFGDKRQLFRRALERYFTAVLAPRLAALEEAPSPLEGLRGLLGEVVAFAAGDPQRRGCLAVNTACELAGHDAEVAALLKQRSEELEHLLVRVIARARDLGEIASGRDPVPQARLLATVIDGLRVCSKRGAERAVLESIASAALAALA